MALVYHDPRTVTQPAQYLTDIEVIYDGGPDGFSLARLRCEGVTHIAIRWNVARKEHDDPAKQSGELKCVGTPSVKGEPSWFILPVELFQPALFDANNPIFRHIVDQL